MLESHTLAAPITGRHTLILGSIHGDETCGSEAIDTVLSRFRDGSLKLLEGKVTMIPRANRRAYDQGVRQIDVNLNRVFGQKQTLTIEHQIARMIGEYIRKADFVLDLHSTHTDDPPFMFLESDQWLAKDFISKAPFQYVLRDWDTLYAQTTDMDSIAYATSLGVPGVTIECGQHQQSETSENALKALMFALEYHGHIAPTKRDTIEQSYVSAREIIYRPENAQFSREWHHLDQIKAGEIIGTSSGGEHRAPYDGYILIPKPEGTTGEEWYYLGK